METKNCLYLECLLQVVNNQWLIDVSTRLAACTPRLHAMNALRRGELRGGSGLGWSLAGYQRLRSCFNLIIAGKWLSKLTMDHRPLPIVFAALVASKKLFNFANGTGRRYGTVCTHATDAIADYYVSLHGGVRCLLLWLLDAGETIDEEQVDMLAEAVLRRTSI